MSNDTAATESALSAPSEPAAARPLPAGTARIRNAVAQLPPYVAGARPEPGRRVFKLSSNENPYPPLPSVVAAVMDAAQQINRYPQMAADDLVDALAADLSQPRPDGTRYAVGPDNVVVGNGSVSLLTHLLQTVVDAGDEVVSPWRSFEAYPILVNVVGGTFVPVPLTAEDGMDFPALAAAVTDRTRAIMLCTPNNPTGVAASHSEIEHFLAQVPSDVLVVIDEAYLEFARNEDPVDGLALVANHSNVVIVRTFSKAYGLAGLRVGFAVGPAEIIGAVRACATPFAVSDMAVRAAIISLQSRDELNTRVASVVAERTRVQDTLAAEGWVFPRSHGNFIWFDLGEASAEFTAAARAEGILVRPFRGEGARVSIGSPAANDAFLAFAREWRAAHAEA